MSNYLSKEISYSQPPADNTFELLAKIAMMKQNKYDTNHQQLQQTLDAYGAQTMLRDVDNQYLASKLSDITNQVNKFENNDLSQSFVTDSVASKIKSVASDPFVINGIKNTRKYNNALAESEVHKKNGTYSDDNFKDMLTQAGYEDYVSGKSDSLGTLQYHDYVDLNTNLHKKAADYAKERGLKDEFLGQETGVYETIDKYGVKVTETEIQNYLMSSLTDKEKAQLQINARKTYSGTSEEAFNKEILADKREENDDLKLNLATVKATLKSMTVDEANEYLTKNYGNKTVISDVESRIQKNEDAISKGVFDKSEMYTKYTSDLIKGVSANYDVLKVTKVDRDHLPFDILKFKTETDIAYKKAQKDAADSVSSGLGTATKKPTTPDEAGLSGMQKVQRANYQADAGLDAYLRESDSEYAKMTPEEQWNYKLHLNPNMLAKGSTATLKTLVDKFKVSQSNYAKAISLGKVKIASTVKENYNNLIQGKDLDLAGLSGTMPLTATYLKSKRTYDSLSREEKLGIDSEFASNNLQYNGDLDGDARIIYEKVVVSNKSELKKLKTPKSKDVLNFIEQSTDTKKVGVAPLNLFSNFMYGTIIKTLKNNYFDAPIDALEYRYDSIVNGDTVANINAAKNLKIRKQDFKDIAENYTQFERSLTDINPIQEDSNVTELDVRDMNFAKNKTPIDVKSSFNALNTALSHDIKNLTDGFMKNQTTTEAFTFSTEDKDQKVIALSIKAAVEQVRADNSGDYNAPATANNDYTVYREGSQFKAVYTDKDGERVTIPLPDLPKNVINVFDTSIQNWSNSPLNPDVDLTIRTIKPFKNPNTRNEQLSALMENIDLSRETEVKLLTDPADTVFATPDEYAKKIRSKDKDFYDTNEKEISSILNTEYTPNLVAKHGVFYVNFSYIENGKELVEHIVSPLGYEKNDYEFELKSRELVAKIKEAKIEALKKTN